MQKWLVFEKWRIWGSKLSNGYIVKAGKRFSLWGGRGDKNLIPQFCIFYQWGHS